MKKRRLKQKKDFVEQLASKREKRTFCSHMSRTIVQLRRLGRVRTAETYLSAFNSFMLFSNGRDTPLNRFTMTMMLEYEAWLKCKGVSMNTSSFYMRILRAAYNRAVDAGMTKQHNPFRHVYTGIGKTKKRAVSICEIRKIKELDLSDNPLMDFARDMFMFSFYTRGMSFIDMAFLRKSDLHDGILSYSRHKTGQQLQIRWEQCMQAIVDKYLLNDTGYMLPIINSRGDERRQYQNAMRLTNNKLKCIASLAGMSVKLTTYIARHSWASIAHAKNIPLAVISEGMGHDNENTTRIYLASLDSSVIDKANELIIEDL